MNENGISESRKKQKRYSTILFALALIPLVIFIALWATGYTIPAGVVFAVMAAMSLAATALGHRPAGSVLIVIFLGLGIAIFNKDGKDANQTIGIAITLITLASAVLWLTFHLLSKRK